MADATPRWRVLACVGESTETAGAGVFSVASSLSDASSSDTCSPHLQVLVLRNPSLEEYRSALTALRPNVVYCCGSATFSDPGTEQRGAVGAFRFRSEGPAPQGPGADAEAEAELLSALAEARPELAYVDAPVSQYLGPSLHQRGVPHVIVWPPAAAGTGAAGAAAGAAEPGAAGAGSSGIPALVASHFTFTLFAFLATPLAKVPEAFAAAAHGTQAHYSEPPPDGPAAGLGCAPGGGVGGAPYQPPGMPMLLSHEQPALPDSTSIPWPAAAQLPCEPAQLTSFPGWSDVRLLAPRAELRLLLAGDSGLVDATRLGFLGEALRALLVVESRALTLLGMSPLPSAPRNLPPGCQAVRCAYATASGATGSVVLGAPANVLQHSGLVQHALRMTLVTDSVSLQFRLPPPGMALPAPRSSRAVAGGVPVVDCVAVTSVWAVEVMRALSRNPRYRCLMALGVAAVGSCADSSCSAGDVQRLGMMVHGCGPEEAAAAAAAAGLGLGSGGQGQPGAGAAGAGAQQPEAEVLLQQQLAQLQQIQMQMQHLEQQQALLQQQAAHGGAGGEGAGEDLQAAVANGHAFYATANGNGVADGNGTTANGHGVLGYCANGAVHHAAPDANGNGNASDKLAAARGSGPTANGHANGGDVEMLDAGGGVGGLAAAEGAGLSMGVLEGSPDGDLMDAADGADLDVPVRCRPAGPLSDRRPPLTGSLPGYVCRRPPLCSCSEAEFLDDLTSFLTQLRGKPIERSKFPEAVLNGGPLDLWALYREVVTRGGFRVGNGINWKGHVFPRMRNWTETNKQTGVGNALKRHYQNYLWEYELAHPEDITMDRCVMCNGGDTVATDWVCCDVCENWVHFSCDTRSGIGSYKDYSSGQGRVYVCRSCSKEPGQPGPLGVGAAAGEAAGQEGWQQGLVNGEGAHKKPRNA